MASFTDNSQQLSQFNPYVQQLPVNEMREVGMYKQNQYNQGLQKIQAQIDTVAGIDVIRDVDKQYLQSKLNDLGSNLRRVAAGDFSNYQLVNSVGGMITNIAKDGNIQNAASSSAKYRREVGNMEAAMKEGKSSIQNQWDFNTRANRWLTSSDIKESFNERYSPYVDVSKKWMDVVKSLHSDLQDVDIAYETNPDGSPNFGKTLAAMQRVSKETVSSAKIENALRASLTPEEQNQLSIDGRYTFRDMDQSRLLNYSTTKYNTQIRDNELRIRELEGFANLSDSNPEMKQKALSTIQGLKENNLRLNEYLAEETDLIRQNPELAKSQIYKNGAISQFATAHSWEHNKSNLLNNPVLEAEHWERNFRLTQDKFQLDVAQFTWKQFKDNFDMEMDQKKLENEYRKTFGDTSAFETYVGESTQVKSPLIAMQNDILDTTASADGMVQEMVKGIKGVNVGQIEEAIKKYTSGNPESITEAEKIIPVEWRQHVNNIVSLRNKATRLESGLENVKEEVYSNPEFANVRQKVKSTVESFPTITITDDDGNPVTFSQDEILSLVGKEEFSIPAGGAIPNIRFAEQLTDKEQLLVSRAGERYNGLEQLNVFGAIGGNNKEAKKIAETIAKYQSAVGETVSENNKNINKALNDRLLTKTGTYIPRLVNIDVDQEKGDREIMDGVASSVLARYTSRIGGNRGGSAELPKGDVEKGREWLAGKDKNKILYKKLEQGDKTLLVMNLGDDEITIPLTQIESAQLRQDVNSPSRFYKELTEAQLLGNGNTNPTGTPENAYYQRFNIPNLRKLDVRADLSWDKSNNAKQYINLQLNIPNIGWTSLKLDRNPMDRENADQFIKSLTDDKVKKLFLESSTIPSTWKDQIKTIQ